MTETTTALQKQKISLQKTNSASETLFMRMPEIKDGKHIYRLVKNSKVLDLNSEYLYLLIGAHFKQTSCVVEIDGKLAGFVSAYVPPGQPDALFVWQIAVGKTQRKRGLALAMLKDIINRPFCVPIKYLQASIAPSNYPSRALFTTLARDLAADYDEQPLFESSHFSKSHESEPLLIIGPLSKQALSKP